MSGPPTDIPADTLVRRLLQQPRPSEIVTFPRKGKDGQEAKIRIMVLEQSEHDDARFAAEEYLSLRGMKPDMRDKPAMKEIYGDAVAREVLFRACVGVDPINPTGEKLVYPRVFMNAKELGTLTTDELVDLFTKYTIVQYKYGPNPMMVRTEEDLTAWITRLREGLDSLPLSGLDWHQLAGLNLLLVKRSYILSTILESLYLILPSTLKLDLEKLGIGTGSFGLHQSNNDDEEFELEITPELVEQVSQQVKDLSALVAELDDDT